MTTTTMQCKPAADRDDTALDAQRLDTYVATKIELTAAQSALSWAMTAAMTVMSVAAAFLPWYTDAAVHPIVGVVLGHVVFVVLPDYFLLPFMKKNIARVEAAGVPRSTWMRHVGTTLCLIGVYAWAPAGLFGIGLGATPRLTVELLVKAVALALLSDIPIIFLHGYLHRHWPDAHMLHHYCTNVSLTSSYFIEWHDLAMEFVLPGLPLMAISLGFLDDPWLYLTAHAITTTWYIISHDAQLKLPHYYHHTQCDSRYNAYVPVKPTYDAADQIRRRIFAIRSSERKRARLAAPRG